MGKIYYTEDAKLLQWVAFLVNLRSERAFLPKNVDKKAKDFSSDTEDIRVISLDYLTFENGYVLQMITSSLLR